MRFYGFDPKELTTSSQQNLALDKDPKLAWALRHREFFPIDINRASRSALLRVPGFGTRNVKRMLSIRRYQALKLGDLAKLRVPLSRARFFVITADHNPAVKQIDAEKLDARIVQPMQMSLFDADHSARNGQL